MAQYRAPRPAPKYDYGVHGQSSEGGNLSLILREGVRASVKKPSWKATETVFRPYPSLRYDNPSEFEPYRLDPGGRNFFGNWIRRYDCWWSVGRDATTMLVHDPETGNRNYDKWSTPLGVLFRAVDGACKNGQGHPEWYPLREGGPGRSKQLKPPGECYLMQGALLCHNDKKTYEGNKAPLGWGLNPPLILVLSQGAGQLLENALNQENEGYRGDPSDFESRYTHGDPVSVDHGRYFHFFEKGHDPRHKNAARPTGPSPFASSGWSRGGSSGGKSSSDIGFDLYIDDNYDNHPAQIPPDSVDMVRSKWLFWEDILYFPTTLEQARMCFEQFPLSACMYAFEGQHEEWIPDEYRRKWRGTATVAAAGVPAPSQPAGLGGGYWGGRPGQPVPQPPAQPSQTPQRAAPQGTGVWGARPGQPPQPPAQLSAPPSAPQNQSFGGHRQISFQPPAPAPAVEPGKADQSARPVGGPWAPGGAAHTDSSVPDGAVDEVDGGVEDEVTVEDQAFFGAPGKPEAVPPAEDPKQVALREDAEAVAKLMAARNR